MCGRAASYSYRWWDEQIRTKLMQDGKYIRRLLMFGKICGMSIVDYGKR